MKRKGLFQYSIDNALEIILMFDAGGTIIYANKEAEKELEYKGSLCGCSIMDVFPEQFQIEDGKLLVPDKSGRSTTDMMAYRGNRTYFPAQGRILAAPATEDEPELYIATLCDISEENFMEKKVTQAEQEVSEAQKVKSEFVANITHELRTPVNGILGNTKELLERETEPDKLKLLQLVERGCHEMHTLINSILDFSKLEAGKFVLEPRQFRFRDMIEYVKGNHSNKITEKGLDFSIMVSAEVPECVVGDELRIVQILNNLISNAYKFTSLGGIHVEVVKTAQLGRRIQLFFMVIDTGIGIAKADQDKLFKSFSQVDASISRKYGGTGLGLNISKQLVELMDGSIHVESDLGKGSIFSFHIWVELPDEQCECQENTDCKQAQEQSQDFASKVTEQMLLYKLQNLAEDASSDKVHQFGEPENKVEIEKKMSKLILSIEMENWEKAEMFAEMIKQLVEGAPKEVKSVALRLKMAVQKEDYEKAAGCYELLRSML